MFQAFIQKKGARLSYDKQRGIVKSSAPNGALYKKSTIKCFYNMSHEKIQVLPLRFAHLLPGKFRIVHWSLRD